MVLGRNLPRARREPQPKRFVCSRLAQLNVAGGLSAEPDAGAHGAGAQAAGELGYVPADLERLLAFDDEVNAEFERYQLTPAPTPRRIEAGRGEGSNDRGAPSS